MKKTVSLILALMMCLSLCACGGPSREEMLEQAVKLDRTELLETMTENAERAKKEYNGKIVELKDVPVYFELGGKKLRTDYRIPLKPAGFTTLSIKIELSEDEMLTVSEGDCISVVGVLEVKSEYDAVLNNAFLIK